MKFKHFSFCRSGKFKGIAYIEYENENSASAAVLKMDLFELRNLRMSVAISAPPPRSSTKGHTVAAANMIGLGEGRRSKQGQQGYVYCLRHKFCSNGEREQ